jgi:hypothetical protein
VGEFSYRFSNRLIVEHKIIYGGDMKRKALTMLLLSLVAAYATAGIPVWHEEVVIRAGFGHADSLFSNRYAANGFYPAEDGIYIADGGRDEIKVFGYDGHFKRQLHVSWPETTVFRPYIYRVFSDMLVQKNKLYILAYCDIRPVGQELRERYPVYQLLVYSAETGELEAHYPIPDETSRLVHLRKDLPLESGDFLVLLSGQAGEIGIGSLPIGRTYYPLLKRENRKMLFHQAAMAMNSIPLGRFRIRVLPHGEAVEIKDDAENVIAKLENVNNILAESPDGRFFATSSYVPDSLSILLRKNEAFKYRIYNNRGVLVAEIRDIIVYGSCDGFIEPPRGKILYRFGPDGFLYYMRCCLDGITIKRWCP